MQPKTGIRVLVLGNSDLKSMNSKIRIAKFHCMEYLIRKPEV